MQNNLNETSHNERYDIMQNDKGQLLIILDYYESTPYMPRLLYDGSTSAILYRNREHAIVLNDIAFEAQQALTEGKEILIVEIGDDDETRKYKAVIRHIESLNSLIR